MFRRPTESSSGTSSEGNESESEDNSVQDLSRGSQRSQDVLFGETDLATTETLSSNDELSIAEHEPVGVLNIERHRNMMLSSLLEDYYKTRAVELANAANPAASLTRDSPEIQPIARRMFEQATQSLTSSGILTTPTTDAQSDALRGQYLAGLDSLGLQNTITDGDGSRQFDRRAQAEQPDGSALDAASMSADKALVLAPSRSIVRSMHPEAAPNHERNLSLQSLALGSTYGDSHLSSTTPTSRSHYESSFQEVKLLGRGGFGRVYHTFNLLDQKEYAIKKIPLSSRLSQKYRERGLSELHHSLREVQALARLDHCNIVRYHSTWIEEPSPTTAGNLVTKLRPIPMRKLIVDTTTALAQGDLPRQAENGQILEAENDDSLFEQPKHQHEDGHNWSPGHSPAVSTLDHQATSSMHASDIFTDGHAHPQNLNGKHIEDDTVFVLHVQMSLYPITLSQYLAPPRANEISPPSSPSRRHCFHLLPALRILLGIICGLQYIHAKGMVHRDIKPNNIFVSSLDYHTPALHTEGYYDIGSCFSCNDADPHFINPRIGDFGLVAELARASGDADNHSSDQEIGTQFYRPPVRRNRKGKRSKQPLNEKLDIYALGVLLVELLWCCGTSTERMVVLKGLQEGRLPDIAAKVDEEYNDTTEWKQRIELGENVEECIRGMIHEDSEVRWSCDKVKERVEDIIRRASLLSAENVRLGRTITQDSLPD